MDIKFITRGLDLSEDEFQESFEMLVKLRALSATEKAQFATALGAQKVVAEKTSKKSSKSSSPKSPRATGIEQQLSKRREQERVGMTKDDNYDGFMLSCVYKFDDGKTICARPADDNIHHLTTHPNYHEFNGGKSTAPLAPARSPANGGAGSGTANSEIAKGDAGIVHRGASGGD